MPVYEYACRTCNAEFTRFLPLAEYRAEQHCPECHSAARKVLSAPIIRGDIEPYQCPITGRAITSRKAHEENLLRHDCRVLERGERQDLERSKQREESKMLAEIDDTVGKLVESLPQDKKERLAGELASTSDATYTRL